MFSSELNLFKTLLYISSFVDKNDRKSNNSSSNDFLYFSLSKSIKYKSS